MAKKKKRRSGKRRSKKRSSGPKAKPLGLAAGATYSGIQGVFVPQGGNVGSMFDALKTLDFQTAVARVPGILKDKDVYMPVLIGLGVSSASKVPLLSIVAKPADKAVKRLTKDKWGL